MSKSNPYDFLTEARKKFPGKDFSLIPVAMGDHAYTMIDKTTKDDVAIVNYVYGDGLFGYKYGIKWITKKKETT